MRDLLPRVRLTADVHGWSYVAALAVIYGGLGLWAAGLIREGLSL